LLENSNHNRCHTGTSITITLHYQGLIQQRRAFGSRRRLWRAPKTLECDQDLELRTKLLRAENGALVPQSASTKTKTKWGIHIAVSNFTSPHFVVEFLIPRCEAAWQRERDSRPVRVTLPRKKEILHQLW